MSIVRLAVLAVFLPLSAGAEVYYFPALPASVRFVPDPRVPFCSSNELFERLGHVFESVSKNAGYADFELRCETNGTDEVAFRLLDAAGKKADYIEASVNPDRSSYDATAFLVGRRLSTGRKTIKAVLSLYQDRLRYGYGSGGNSSFDAGDWSASAASFYKALESGLEPEFLYFGLYASHAKLGHAARARWYLMAHCAEAGVNPAKLSDAKLAFLRSVPRSTYAPAPASLDRFRGLQAAKQWGAAISELKDLIEIAPWTVEAYEALAKSYDALGWTLLADNWRARGKLARRVKDDDKLHGRLLDALQGP